ncbi:MAG: hypothetical protein GX022_01695 [Clostridiaceae bacterium]|nr:hypothetical protein [Clostridiaceae bacterium]
MSPKPAIRKKNAEILGQKTGLPVYEHEDALKHLGQQDEIIYMGWLCASSIKGYKKAAEEFKVKAVCGVGMRRPGEEALRDMVRRNNISGPKAFYLQGGYDEKKLTGIYKLLMKIFTKALLKQLEKKEFKTDEELETIDMIKNSRSLVKEENLVPILEWINKAD